MGVVIITSESESIELADVSILFPLTVALLPSTIRPFFTTKSLLLVVTEVPYPLGYTALRFNKRSVHLY